MFCCFTVIAEETSSVIITRPGQNAELLCTVTPSESQTAAWIINHEVHTVQYLHNGILTGYSSNGSNLIIENIMMNDNRNDTEYICGIVPSTGGNPTMTDIVNKSDPTILYVAGEYNIMWKILSALASLSCVCICI